MLYPVLIVWPICVLRVPIGKHREIKRRVTISYMYVLRICPTVIVEQLYTYRSLLLLIFTRVTYVTSINCITGIIQAM